MKNLKVIGLLMIGACLLSTTESFANPNTKTEMATNFDIIPATTPIVSLEQAKQQLRIEPDFTDDDALITQMTASAEEWAKAYIGRPFAYRLEVEMSAFGTAPVEMSCLPVASLDRVEYVANEEGEYATLGTDLYKFRQSFSLPNTYELTFKGELPALPPDNNRAVRIIMNAACPEPVRSAILLRLSDLYERREDREVNEASAASTSLLRPYKTNW
jgi:hypothetical protein